MSTFETWCRAHAVEILEADAAAWAKMVNGPLFRSLFPPADTPKVELVAITDDEPARVDLVEREFFNPRHDKHSGRFAPAPATEIGVTPNRGPSRGSIEEVQPYFGTSRYKGFEKKATATASAHGVKVLKTERAAGFWEGSLEPSAQIQAKGRPASVKSYALNLAKTYNQDAVIEFTPNGKGTARRYRWHVDDPAGGITALKGAGIMGATIKGKTVEVLDLDGSALPSIRNLRGALGRGSVARGDGGIFFKGTDYTEVVVRSAIIAPHD